MAETREQKQAGATPPTAEKAGAAAASGEQRPSFFSRILAPAPRGGSGSQNARTPTQQSPLGKRFLGLMILLIVIEFVTIGLQYIDLKVFNGTLEKPWFHTNAFIIGGINNSYFAITLVVIGIVYYLLLRFNLLPRDLFNPNPRAAAATQSRQPGRAAPDGLGTERRTRAARRHSASTLASRQATTTRRTTSTKTREPAPPAAPTGHDEEYYRVKAAVRQQRRREAKR